MDTYFGCTIENLRLGGHETYWRDLFSFLESRGYTLRPRYRPGWEPPWPPTPEIPFASTEDCIGLPVCNFREILHSYQPERRDGALSQSHDRCNTRLRRQAGNVEGDSVHIHRGGHMSLFFVPTSLQRPSQPVHPITGGTVASGRP